MPTLKHLTCKVEWAGSNLPLQEYQTTYSDGYVETYIAVPPIPTPFSIHLQSHGYIAPGLAMFVFMDGIYQCNRNRHNLRIPDGGPSKRHSEIDFRVRQKEDLLWDGTFEGRQWRFAKVNIISDPEPDGSPSAPHGGEYVGTIEVVVLRCYPSDASSTSSSTTAKPPIIEDSSSSSNSDGEGTLPMGGMFDGAGNPKRVTQPKSKALGLDGSWDDWDKPAAPEEAMGRIEMTSANEGVMHPVTQRPNSNKAIEKSKCWDSRNESRNYFQSDWDTSGSQAGSQRGRSRQPRGSTNQQSPPTLHLRGGAPGSYSVSTVGTPGVVINFNQNGNPPGGAQIDPWMNISGGEPAFDFSKPPPFVEPDPDTKDQEGAWQKWRGGNKNDTLDENEKQSTGSYSPKQEAWKPDNGMPGGWEATGGDDTQKNNGWNNTRGTSDWTAPKKGAPRNDNRKNTRSESSWDKPKDGPPKNGARDNAGVRLAWDGPKDNAAKKDTWKNTGGGSSWGAPKDDSPKDDGGWGQASDQPSGSNDDWGANENNDTQQNDVWETNANDAQQNDSWNTNANNGFQQDNTWDAGNNNNNQQDKDWGAEKMEVPQTAAGAKDPKNEIKVPSNRPARNLANEGNSIPNFSFGNSKGKASKAGSQGQPSSIKSKEASIQSKAKPFSFQWPKTSPKKQDDRPWSPAVPGAWSPPMVISKAKDSEVKPAEPIVARASPSFSIPTAPKAKPYWSQWKGADTIDEEDEEEDKVPLPEKLDAPIYSVPTKVAERHNMSHQVRPGRPAAYSHKTSTPKYMDTHEDPYAIFVFNYRDKAIIEDLFSTTIIEPEHEEKARLASLSKEEIVEELIKANAKLSSQATSTYSGSSDLATLNSNPNAIPLGPDINMLDQKLKKLETGGDTAPVVNSWLSNSGGNPPKSANEKWSGNGNNSGNAWGDATNRPGNAGNGTGNCNRNDNAGDTTTGAGNGRTPWGNDNNNRNNGDETKGNIGWEGNGSGGGDPWGNNNQDNGKTDNNWGGNGDKADDAFWGNNDQDDNKKGADDRWGATGDDGGGGGGWGGNDQNNGRDIDDNHDNGGDTSWGAKADCGSGERGW